MITTLTLKKDGHNMLFVPSMRPILIIGVRVSVSLCSLGLMKDDHHGLLFLAWYLRTDLELALMVLHLIRKDIIADVKIVTQAGFQLNFTPDFRKPHFKFPARVSNFPPDGNIGAWRESQFTPDKSGKTLEKCNLGLVTGLRRQNRCKGVSPYEGE